MRKIWPIMLCLLCISHLLTLNACDDSDNDDGGNIDNNRIVGTWNVTSASFKGTISNINVGTINATTQGTITFRENGTGQENYSFTIEGITIKEDDAFT